MSAVPSALGSQLFVVLSSIRSASTWNANGILLVLSPSSTSRLCTCAGASRDQEDCLNAWDSASARRVRHSSVRRRGQGRGGWGGGGALDQHLPQGQGELLAAGRPSPRGHENGRQGVAEHALAQPRRPRIQQPAELPAAVRRAVQQAQPEWRGALQQQ